LNLPPWLCTRRYLHRFTPNTLCASINYWREIWNVKIWIFFLYILKFRKLLGLWVVNWIWPKGNWKRPGWPVENSVFQRRNGRSWCSHVLK
jgi:hypothetical protein